MNAVCLTADEEYVVVHLAHGGYVVVYGDGRTETREATR